MCNFEISHEPDLNSQSWYDFYEWFNVYSKFPIILLTLIG